MSPVFVSIFGLFLVITRKTEKRVFFFSTTNKKILTFKIKKKNINNFLVDLTCTFMYKLNLKSLKK